jgi:hypothetical protein
MPTSPFLPAVVFPIQPTTRSPECLESPLMRGTGHRGAAPGAFTGIQEAAASGTFTRPRLACPTGC